MRAIRIHKAGGPEVLQLDEVELPPPGPGEARVRHHAIGVNYLDVYYRSGLYAVPHFPATLGSEGAGDVGGDDIGEGCFGGGVVGDQRVEVGAALGVEDAGDGVVVGGVCAEAVDGFGAEGDEAAGLEEGCGAGDAVCGGGQDLGHSRPLAMKCGFSKPVLP